MPQHNAISVAVVGAGTFGARHARALADSARAELQVIVDPNEKTGREIADLYHADWVPTVTEALDRYDLTAFTVAVPDALHVEAALPLLEAGKSVLLEKPMAHTLEAARVLADAAARNNARLMVGHLFRFDPRYASVRRAVEAGQLGELLHASATRLSFSRVGVKANGNTSVALFLGIHEIDAVQWFTGQRIRAVSAKSVSKALPAQGVNSEDATVAIVEFGNGAVGQLCFGWTLPANARTGLKINVELIGTAGVIQLNTEQTGVTILTASGTVTPEPVFLAEVNGHLAGSIPTEIDAFLSSLQANTEFPVPLGDVMSAVAVTDAIHRSITSGSWEAVDEV